MKVFSGNAKNMVTFERDVLQLIRAGNVGNISGLHLYEDFKALILFFLRVIFMLLIRSF